MYVKPNEYFLNINFCFGFIFQALQVYKTLTTERSELKELNQNGNDDLEEYYSDMEDIKNLKK